MTYNVFGGTLSLYTTATCNTLENCFLKTYKVLVSSGFLT